MTFAEAFKTLSDAKPDGWSFSIHVEASNNRRSKINLDISLFLCAPGDEGKWIDEFRSLDSIVSFVVGAWGSNTVDLLKSIGEV